MDALYVESSALVTVLIEGDAALERQFRVASARIASALTILETRRSLDLARRTSRITDDDFKVAVRKLRRFKDRSHILAIDDQIMTAAEQEFPAEPVRSLDAVHLASAMVWSVKIGTVTVASHDRRIRANALALGFAIAP